MLRITPPKQRLHPHHAVVAQAKFGLIVELQLIFLHRAPQSALEVEPVSQPRAHGGGVHHDRAGGAALAWYMAVSACLSTVATSGPSSG